MTVSLCLSASLSLSVIWFVLLSLYRSTGEDDEGRILVDCFGAKPTICRASRKEDKQETGRNAMQKRMQRRKECNENADGLHISSRPRGVHPMGGMKQKSS